MGGKDEVHSYLSNGTSGAADQRAGGYFFVLFGADLGRTGIMRYNEGVGYDKTEELFYDTYYGSNT